MPCLSYPDPQEEREQAELEKAIRDYLYRVMDTDSQWRQASPPIVRQWYRGEHSRIAAEARTQKSKQTKADRVKAVRAKLALTLTPEELKLLGL